MIYSKYRQFSLWDVSSISHGFKHATFSNFWYILTILVFPIYLKKKKTSQNLVVFIISPIAIFVLLIQYLLLFLQENSSMIENTILFCLCVNLNPCFEMEFKNPLYEIRYLASYRERIRINLSVLSNSKSNKKSQLVDVDSSCLTCVLIFSL